MESENIQSSDNFGGKSLRLLRPSVVVLCGPAACGKSTFAKKHFRPTQIISSDWARALVCDDERDQRFNASAFALVHFLIEQRLMINRLCVVDSTALTAPARRDLLDLARKHQVPITLICFNVPLATCLERDEQRERTVGRAIIERQYQAYEQSKEVMKREGFDQIFELQEADLDKVQIEILFRPVMRSTPRPPRPGLPDNRRFDRPAQFYRSKSPVPGVNGTAHPAETPPAATLVAPHPSTLLTAAAASKARLTQPGEASAPVTPAPPRGTSPAPPLPVKVAKPAAATAAQSSRPVPPSAPPPVPITAHSSGGR